MFSINKTTSLATKLLGVTLLFGAIAPMNPAQSEIITKCGSYCPSGYHYIGEGNKWCENPYADAIRCERDEGHYFTKCDGVSISCPSGYFTAAFNLEARGGNADCPIGNKAPNRVLCKRTMGQSFKTCGYCPSGYEMTNIEYDSERCVRDNLRAHDLRTCACTSADCLQRKALKRFYRSAPYNPGLSGHAFAVSEADEQRLRNQGYQYERKEGYVYDFPFENTVPLYELFYIDWSTLKRDYYYTVSTADRDTAISLGYQYLGPIGYVTWDYEFGVLPTKRLLGHYLYSHHDHFYTVSTSQSNIAKDLGYIYEGVEGRTFDFADWNGQ